MEIEENNKTNQPKTVEVSKKAMILGCSIVLMLVLVAVILAYTLPTGSYEKVLDDKGNWEIPENGKYTEDNTLPRIVWWKILLSPLMILDPRQQGSGMIWSILILLFVLGAIFTALDKTNILVYMVEKLRFKYSNKKYILLFLMPLLFMFFWVQLRVCLRKLCHLHL